MLLWFEQDDEGTCINGGRLDQNNTCICVDGYAGTNCETLISGEFTIDSLKCATSMNYLYNAIWISKAYYKSDQELWFAKTGLYTQLHHISGPIGSFWILRYYLVG